MESLLVHRLSVARETIHKLCRLQEFFQGFLLPFRMKVMEGRRGDPITARRIRVVVSLVRKYVIINSLGDTDVQVMLRPHWRERTGRRAERGAGKRATRPGPSPPRPLV